MSTAPNLDLSSLGFYPFVKIKPKQMNIEQYICIPAQIQGIISKAISGSRIRLKRRPTASPQFMRMANFRFVLEVMPVCPRR